MQYNKSWPEKTEQSLGMFQTLKDSLAVLLRCQENAVSCDLVIVW